mmetsp:Transcript_12565/g.33857  ORF Transcript_12565/g.33857 Transcript_12565/m.33857 type:complete len:795 (+) Transcript_12565:177-2561(+)
MAQLSRSCGGQSGACGAERRPRPVARRVACFVSTGTMGHARALQHIRGSRSRAGNDWGRCALVRGGAKASRKAVVRMAVQGGKSRATGGGIEGAGQAVLSEPLSPILSVFRSLDAVPESEQGEGWLEWFKMCTDAFGIKGYDALAASRHVRVLAKFAVVSPPHREAVMRYLESSQWISLWKTKMSVLLGAMSETQLADTLYNIAYLEIFGKRVLSTQFYEQWFVHVAPLAEISAPALSRVAWAIGMLGLRPDETFKHAYATAFNREFASFRSYHLADIIWAFGRVDASMPSEFFELWFSAFEREREHFNAGDLAVTIWGLARLNCCPDQTVLGFWRELTLQHAERLSANDLANIMFALGRLELHPGDDFLLVWFARWKSLYADMDAQALVDSLWGLAKLNVRPPSEMLMLFYEGWRRERLFIRPRELELSLYAFARLYVTPRNDFFEHWYETFKRRLVARSFEQMEEYQMEYFASDFVTIASFLWAFARLDVRPTDAFMQKWYDIAQVFTRFMNPQQLTNALWAFGRLSIRPRDAFFQQWLAAFDQKSAQFEVVELVRVATALVELKIYPPEPLLQQWCRSFAPRVIDASGGELADALYAFGRLRVRPSVGVHADWNRFLSAWSFQFRARASSMSAAQLVNVLWGFARLEVRPGADTLNAWARRMIAVAAELDARLAANALWALAKLKVRPSARLSGAWVDAWNREASFADGHALKVVRWAAPLVGLDASELLAVAGDGESRAIENDNGHSSASERQSSPEEVIAERSAANSRAVGLRERGYQSGKPEEFSSKA